MTPLFRKFIGIHWILFLSMALLLSFGILSIYSAVHFRQEELFFLHDEWRRQMNWALAGIGVCLVASLIDYKWIRWGALPMYGIGIFLLVLVQVKGVEINGNRSWLKLPGIPQFQPSQFAICSTILLMSVILSDGSKFLPWLKYHFLRMIAALSFFLVTLAFILKEGDLGSAMVVVPVCVVMLVAGGVPFRYLIAGFLSAMIVLPIIYFSLKPQQQGRISVCYQMLMGQKVDALGSAWAATNTQIAIGSGGWEGKGIYQPQAEEVSETDQPLVHMTGIGKVPEKTSHDDFIFTVIAESFGFRVAGLLIMGFVFVFLLILMVSLFARDTLGRVLAAGITGLFLGHTFEHIGMNIGLLPITGIPLPLISYGGTFLLITMFLFGMVQSVWVHRNFAVEAEEPTKASRSGVRNSPAISYAG